MSCCEPFKKMPKNDSIHRWVFFQCWVTKGDLPITMVVQLSCDCYDLLFPIRAQSIKEFNNHSLVYSLSLLSWASPISIRRSNQTKVQEAKKVNMCFFHITELWTLTILLLQHLLLLGLAGILASLSSFWKERVWNWYITKNNPVIFRGGFFFYCKKWDKGDGQRGPKKLYILFTKSLFGEDLGGLRGFW